ncbi:MAG: S9 family peptidase [bacterium]
MSPTAGERLLRHGSSALLAFILAASATSPADAQTSTKRPLRAADIYQLRGVNDPQLSPDGAWVAYSVSAVDSAKDKSDTDIWMTSWDGAQTIRVTSSPESESSPRWSPDGRYLAFVSGRQEGKGGQVWLLDRRGGEAQRLTMIKGGLSEFDWSPDSKRLVLVLDEETDSVARKDTAEHKTPKPIVIDRYNFKRDIAGYLGSKRTHLALFDVATKKLDSLTSESYDDASPSWSPDGQRIAFVRDAPPEPDRARDSHIFVIDARRGATAKQLTDGNDGSRPAWSPDGKWIAFTRGDEAKFGAYNLSKLAVVPSDGGAARIVSGTLDRAVSSLRFTADGSAVQLVISDDRAEQLARIKVSSGAIERVIGGKRSVAGYSTLADGRTAVLMSTIDRAPEVFALDGADTTSLRRITHQNDSLFTQLQLSSVDDFTSKSKDGTEVHSLLFKPAAASGTRLPLILYIHGGPNGQDSYRFDFDRQFFAANGYAVLGVNYRGSSGRGSAYQKAIFADWGNKEVVDLIGAVDEAVRTGVADPDRLGIGGWSYGGILTDYTIATTNRFKAAVSGAGSANQLSMYGTDQYITQYNMELGAPWKAPDTWMKVSYPFFHADRIKTPTLFMGGQSDFNVPIIGGEQMYQALRTLNVETRLVIYPSQFHGITVPSYKIDRLKRYLDWYDRHLKATVSASATATVP